MANILDVLANLESIDLRNEVPRIVKSYAPEMIDYNLEQLTRGETSEGKRITPLYSNEEYAKYKSSLNSLAGYKVADLKLTGAFYAGWKVDFQALDFFFSSSDSKSLYLEGKYSGNGGIFGLTDDNKGNFAQDDIKPAIIAHIEKKTGLKLS